MVVLWDGECSKVVEILSFAGGNYVFNHEVISHHHSDISYLLLEQSLLVPDQLYPFVYYSKVGDTSRAVPQAGLLERLLDLVLLESISFANLAFFVDLEVG